jgi:hypothetical protein
LFSDWVHALWRLSARAHRADVVHPLPMAGESALDIFSFHLAADHVHDLNLISSLLFPDQDEAEPIDNWQSYFF